jgi:orotate phosphoribosyltransferase-like protein
MIEKSDGGRIGQLDEASPVVARIWAGRLLVTSKITSMRNAGIVADAVRESVYFDFYGDHPEHGYDLELTVGLAADPVPVNGHVTVVFPAVLTIFNPRMSVQEVHAQVRTLVEEVIKNWYEGPKTFDVVVVDELHTPAATMND